MEILLKTNGADLESCKLSLEAFLKNASSLTAEAENCTAHLEAASNRTSKVEENANSLLADLDSCKLSLEASLKNGSCLQKKAKLEVNIKFKADGAQKDVIYVFITFFMNKNLALNAKDKVFFSPHNIAQH